MDREARTNIQRATQTARVVLEQEYAAQLEGMFDIRLDGTVAAGPGAHLNATQRALRTKLVTAVDHQRAGGMAESDAVAAFLREAAFTTLNRFVALKMLEAREVVQECITRGDQSSGFKEFSGLAPGLVQLPDHGYRVYIETVFDEIGREVRVLFDRRDTVSLLWPRRQALHDLLGVLNASDLSTVWIEDETAGWVYQYFNGEGERRTMREASQGPRNSRELAVRNQFFTPRYVVQFLVENTVGRTWYEMMRGETVLRDLEYMVRTQHEVFLAEDDPLPESLGGIRFGDSEEHPTLVRFRKKKDPRDLKVLDPACGSGHFLLYTFDLLLTLYEDAWKDENAAVSNLTGFRLNEDYPKLKSLRAAAPELILRHNLYGIDIDPRCSQIAAFVLWLRAQRAFTDAGLDRGKRTTIYKTNIVVAEPMPGELDLRQDFCATLDPGLGRLVEHVFDYMDLAGESGYLLRIPEQTKEAIRQNYGDIGGIFRQVEKRDWENASRDLLAALDTFAAQSADKEIFARQLFSGDAVRGLGFIDVCRQRFDVILMNPPFGDLAVDSKTYLEQRYTDSKSDICGMFIQRALEIVEPGGLVGAITNRTPFFLAGHARWRESLIGDYQLSLFADLGDRVLDALVETATYTIANRDPRDEQTVFFRLVKTDDKAGSLSSAISELANAGASREVYCFNPRELRSLPGTRFAYWVPPGILRAFQRKPTLGDLSVSVDVGMSSKDDFRFVRALWEIDPESVVLDQEQASSTRPWMPLAKGGEYAPYVGDIHLAVKWAGKGSEIAALVVARYPYLKGNTDWVLHPESHYGHAGLTYSKRTTSAFGPRLLPEGCMFNDQGIGVFPEVSAHRFALLGLLMTRAVQFFVELSMASADAVSSGSAARHYETSVVSNIVSPERLEALPGSVRECVGSIVERLLTVSSTREPSMFFVSPVVYGVRASLLESFFQRYYHHLKASSDCIVRSFEIERNVRSSFGFGLEEEVAIDDEVGLHPGALERLPTIDVDKLESMITASESGLIKIAATMHGASRSISKKAYIAHRKLELISAILQCHPEVIVERQIAHSLYAAEDLREFARDVLSYAVGVTWGRWDLSHAECLPDSLGIGPGNEATMYPPARLRHFKEDQVYEGEVSGGSPANITWEETLVDDLGHPRDIVACVRNVLEAIWGDEAESVAGEASETLGFSNLRDYFRSSSGFFSDHLRRYSRSRRKAPIYWQLATPSTSYSAWLYYDRLNPDSLFRLLNDHISPKLYHEERKLSILTQDSGANFTSSQRREIATQEHLVSELRSFSEEVARVAPLWKPDLDDGVIINFAPLWRLVPHLRTWQKECKKTWEKLCNGEYDWAHLALHLWPERVLPKCAVNRSLAIAHGVESTFWYEDLEGKWEARKLDRSEIEHLVEERTSTAVKDALSSLLQAPAPAARQSARRSGRGSGPRRRVARFVPSGETNSLLKPRSSEVAIGLLTKVKEAIATNASGASKSEVIRSTGITASEWSRAIKALVVDGSVVQSGQRRGARYHARRSET